MLSAISFVVALVTPSPAQMSTAAPTPVPSAAQMFTAAPTPVPSAAQMFTAAPTQVPSATQMFTAAPTPAPPAAQMFTAAPTPVPSAAQMFTAEPTPVPSAAQMFTAAPTPVPPPAQMFTAAPSAARPEAGSAPAPTPVAAPTPTPTPTGRGLGLGPGEFQHPSLETWPVTAIGQPGVPPLSVTEFSEARRVGAALGAQSSLLYFALPGGKFVLYVRDPAQTFTAGVTRPVLGSHCTLVYRLAFGGGSLETATHNPLVKCIETPADLAADR